MSRTNPIRSNVTARPRARRPVPQRGRLPGVDRKTERLLAAAMKLPPAARAALAGSLIDSLDQDIDPDAEAEWAIEIARRVRELDAGRSVSIPWAEARRIIRGE